MELIAIDDIHDERLKDYLAFNDKALKKRKDACFIETLRLIERALENGYEFESLIVVEEERERWEGLVEEHFSDIPVYLVTRKTFKALVKYEILTGLLGIAGRKADLGVDEMMRGALERRGGDAGGLRLVVCNQIKEPANCGSLVRVCTAFGVDGLILGHTSADPYYRRSARVSMGTCYRLPICITEDLGGAIVRLREGYGVRVIATVLDDDARVLHEIPNRAEEHLAIMLGHEVHGLPEALVGLADEKAIIPMHLGTDSLNLSVSAAVFLYHFGQKEVGVLPEASDIIE